MGKKKRHLYVIAGGKSGSQISSEKFNFIPCAAVLEEASTLLSSLQKEDGHWVFELEADVTIPAEYVMLQRFLGRPINDDIRERLTLYLLDRQLPDGGWPLYAVDGNADLSASVKAYFALKILGHNKNESCMIKARQVILALGGAECSNVFTRIALAIFGQVPWHTPPVMPVEIILLPRWFFFHLGKVAYWSRTVIAPLLILYAQKPICSLRPEECITELFIARPETLFNIDRFRPRAWRKNFFIAFDRILKDSVHLIPAFINRRAQKKAELWTRERMQGEGGIGAIFPAMAYAVMALKVLGCKNDDADFMRGITAIDDLLMHRIPNKNGPSDNGILGYCLSRSSAAPEIFPRNNAATSRSEAVTLCQPCSSPVWDTCMSLTALMESGFAQKSFSEDKTMRWLFDRQITAPGDWATYSPRLEGGGWAFQYENTRYPDLDDTSKVLMSLFRANALKHEQYQDKINRAVMWVIGMQNSDGGWGAFDKDNNRLYLNDIPFADHGALLDPSTSDVTGRCIEMLGMLGYGKAFSPIARGINFLRNNQEKFGGWFGRWGVNYIYGTWSVLSGLKQAGEDMRQSYVKKAVTWLMHHQNQDGGWGESCASYDNPSLAGMGASTASQTAWALLALMAAGEVDSSSVQRGVEYLVKHFTPHVGWEEPYFTGTGFPRVFYLRYHGYSLYFPIWALGVYHRKKNGLDTVQESVQGKGSSVKMSIGC